MTTTLKNPVTIAIVELAEAIEAYQPLTDALTDEGSALTVFTEWPADGQFQEPSVTILAPSVRFGRYFPSECAYDVAIDGPKNNAQRWSRYRIGELDISLDIHIYCKTLRQRGIVEAGLFNLLEGGRDRLTDDFPQTLRILSDKYYNERLRYNLSTDSYQDGQETQLQSQYITILSLSCDMNWIVTRQEYEINKIYLYTQCSLESLLNQQVDAEILTIS